MLNRIMLIGNLGRDPDMNVTPDGTPVTKFSIAVNRRFKSQAGGQKEETDWFNVVAWRQLAEVCNTYLRKGSKVYVEGRLTQRKYKDKNGIERTAIEVIASGIEMLSPKEAGVSEEDDFLAPLDES